MRINEYILQGSSLDDPKYGIVSGDYSLDIDWTGAVTMSDGHILRYVLDDPSKGLEKGKVILVEEEWTKAGSFSWTTPERVESINLRMIGGGGGANSGNDGDHTYNGGGRGSSLEEIIQTTENIAFNGVVGTGGQSVNDGTGKNGSSSSFGDFSTSGGQGGGFTSNGGTITEPTGVFTNGTGCGPDSIDNYWRGGTAGFANGPGCGHSGIRGSGAGADSYGSYKGGDGVVRLTYEPIPYFPGWYIGSLPVIDIYKGTTRVDSSYFGENEPGE